MTGICKEEGSYTTGMEFFDCNVSYGMDIAASQLYPVHTIDRVHAEMKRAGVAKAVVWRIESATAGAQIGNAFLAQDLKKYDNMYGVWALLPPHTHEVFEPDRMLDEMRKNRIIGWKLCPGQARFMVKPFVLRTWLELAVRHNIPLFVDTADGTSLEALAGLLEAYPELTVIFTDANTWPNDRNLRPFVAEFPNVYLDLSYCITAGGIEAFVKEYGASRLLYGSRFPYSYFGANMLMIKHADIDEQDKVAIAGGNMKRIIEVMDL